MAEAIVSAGMSAGKSLSHSFNIVHPGLVPHALISAETQVQLLSIVDTTGSATIEDCIEALPGHPAPVSAVLALVDAGILALEPGKVLDGSVRVTRASADKPEPPPIPAGGKAPVPQPPEGVTALHCTHFSPTVHIVDGQHRSQVRKIEGLQAPGIYIALWDREAYVGTAEDLARRLRNGTHLASPHPADRIIAITDAAGHLTPRLARVAERFMHSLVRHAGDLTVLNGLPDGDHVSASEYDQVRLFVTAAALQLRHAGMMFTSGNARFVMAGPRTMADDLGPLRLDDLPAGIAYELNGCGVTAWAVERPNGPWILLKGSEIRRKVVTSANSSASQRRAEWLYAGVLGEGDGCYRLTRDVVFETGSGAAHFVLGSKSKSLAGWVPIAEPELPDPVI
jgi:hypothetical protein